MANKSQVMAASTAQAAHLHSSVTLGQLLNLSEPQFPHRQNREYESTYLIGCCED